MILDFYTDSSKRLFYKVATEHQLPEFVKNAAICSDADLKTLPDSTFADDFNRLFPCHTAADTAVSYLYFKAQSDGIDKKACDRIEKNFDHFLNLFNLDKNEITKVVEITKDAKDYVSVTADNNQIFDYYVKTASDFDASVTQFIKDFPHITPKCRLKLAQAFLEKIPENADKHNCAFLYSAARQEPANPTTVKDGLAKRAARLSVNDPDYKLLHELMEKVASADPNEVVDALDNLDLRRGFVKDYPDDIPTPEQTCFTSAKIAKQIIESKLVKLGNKQYKLATLSKLPIEVFSAVSTEFANEISEDGLSINPDKLKKLASNLTKEQISQLRNRIQDSGFEKNALFGYTFDELAQFSDEYVKKIAQNLDESQSI